MSKCITLSFFIIISLVINTTQAQNNFELTWGESVEDQSQNENGHVIKITSDAFYTISDTRNTINTALVNWDNNLTNSTPINFFDKPMDLRENAENGNIQDPSIRQFYNMDHLSKKIVLNKYNLDSLNLIKSNVIDLTGNIEQRLLQGCQEINGVVWIFTTTYNKDTKTITYWGQTINLSSLTLNEDAKALFEINADTDSKFNFSRFVVMPLISKDKSRIMFSTAIIYLDGEYAFGYLNFHFDQDLNPLYQQKLTFDHNKDLADVSSVTLDNNGDVYYICRKYGENTPIIWKDLNKEEAITNNSTIPFSEQPAYLKDLDPKKVKGFIKVDKTDKSCYNYQIVSITDKSESQIHYEISAPDYFLKTPHLLLTANEIVFASYFTIGWGSTDGYNYARFTKNNQTPKHLVFNKFKSSLLLANLTAKEKEKGLKKLKAGKETDNMHDYSVRDIIQDDQRNVFIIGEWKREKISETGSNSGVSKVTTTFLNSDILITVIDTTGKKKWSKRVYKESDTKNTDKYSSYSNNIFFNGQNHFLYNNNRENIRPDMNKGGYQSWDGKTKNAVVQLTTFDSEYKAKVHSFKSTENEEHVIFPDRTKMIGSDKILLFGFNDRKFKFGMITISDK